MCFRNVLEAHNLSLQILATVNATLTAKVLLLNQGTVVDAMLIAALMSTNNSNGKLEQSFRVIKRQFGYVKVNYRGLDKNTANLVMLFALSNL